MIKPYQGSTGGKKVSRQISIHEEDRDSSSLLEEEEAKLRDHFDQSSAGRKRNGNVMHTKLRSQPGVKSISSHTVAAPAKNISAFR